MIQCTSMYSTMLVNLKLSADLLGVYGCFTYFNPPGPSSGPTSSSTPGRRQRDWEVLAVSSRFCCSSADKTLGRSTWDLQGLGRPGMWTFPAFSMDSASTSTHLSHESHELQEYQYLCVNTTYFYGHRDYITEV